MRIIEIILLIIVYAIGITIAEYNGWKRGVNSTLSLLDIDDIIKLIKKYGTPKENHRDADIKLLGNCSNCLFKIMDMETGEMECGNADSPAFGNQVLDADTCNSYCYDVRIEERRKSNDD